MIPYQLALVSWIIFSALLMRDKNNARAFSIAYIGAIAFMPSGAEIALPAMPDLDKANVATIGVLIGTIFYHPRLFERLTLRGTDFIFILIMISAFLSSFVNDFGIYDGASKAAGMVINFILPILLARIHLGTPASLKTFLRFIVYTALIYVPLTIYEWRMSPQLHTYTYGYFQHVFQQHMRWGFFRPIGYFYHALTLGRFLAFAAFLALLPMRRDLVRNMGTIGNYVFIPILIALLFTMSFGPWLLFLLLTAAYLLLQHYKYQQVLDSLLYVLPFVAFLWLGLKFADINPEQLLLEIAIAFNEERGESLGYRLIALDEYKSIILHQPWFGWGGWGAGRIEGRATDSQALIRLLNYGVFGTIVYFGWWAWALHTTTQIRRWTAGTHLSASATATALLASACIAVTVIDAGLDLHLLLLLGACTSINTWLKQNDPQTIMLKAHNTYKKHLPAGASTG